MGTQRSACYTLQGFQGKIQILLLNTSRPGFPSPSPFYQPCWDPVTPQRPRTPALRRLQFGFGARGVDYGPRDLGLGSTSSFPPSPYPRSSRSPFRTFNLRSPPIPALPSLLQRAGPPGAGYTELPGLQPTAPEVAAAARDVSGNTWRRGLWLRDVGAGASLFRFPDSRRRSGSGAAGSVPGPSGFVPARRAQPAAVGSRSLLGGWGYGDRPLRTLPGRPPGPHPGAPGREGSKIGRVANSA